MRLEWARVSRRPRWPAWAVVVLLVWGAMVGAAVYLEHRTGQQVILCHFRRLTGLPCPTCGSTRGVLSLAHGDLVHAWAHNPMVATLGAVAALLLLLRIALRVQPRIVLTGWERRAVWALGFVVLGANWVYLMVSAG